MAESADMADCEDVLQEFLLEDITISGRELGTGSYSSVLELDYKGLKCAGKRIHRNLYAQGVSIGPEILERFGNECELLSQLRHPRIVQFLGLHFEGDEDVPILVLEFMPAALSDTLERYGLLPDEVIYSILYDVAIGLHYLHEHHPPIIHRDLTANNVLLTSDMRAKITDLGMAKLINLSPAQVSHRMTVCPGTVSYMPPEALTADPVYDTKLDCFSYGILMVHMFSGEWPLAAEYLQPDPDRPGHLRPLTELERRDKYLKRLAPGHPLLELIRQCLKNISSERPAAKDILDTVCRVASSFPATFENRLEMLKRITSGDMEIAKLQKEMERVTLSLHEEKHRVESQRLKGEGELEVLREKISRLEQLHVVQVASIKELRDENTRLQHSLVEKEQEMEATRKQNERLRNELQLISERLRERSDETTRLLERLRNDVATQSEEREKTIHSLTRGQMDVVLERARPGHSTSQLTRDYEEFFLGTADEAVEVLRAVPGIRHFQAQRLACEMMEQSYSVCKTQILAAMSHLLEELFKVDNDQTQMSTSSALHDVRLAYGLLLRAKNYMETYSQHNTGPNQLLRTFLKRDCLRQTSRSVHTALQTYLDRSCQLALSLLTTCPPMILAQPTIYREDWLDREFEYWDKHAQRYKLCYTRPVLFASHEGTVGVKGWVGNTRDAGQTTPPLNSRTKGSHR